jgi:hypothetical protein
VQMENERTAVTMQRSEAYHILGKMWEDATPKGVNVGND